MPTTDGCWNGWIAASKEDEETLLGLGVKLGVYQGGVYWRCSVPFGLVLQVQDQWATNLVNAPEIPGGDRFNGPRLQEEGDK